MRVGFDLPDELNPAYNLCPDGRQGWLHKMTLGDVVIDPSTQAGDSWTSGDGGPQVGGFEDILRAYTEKRQQFGDA